MIELIQYYWEHPVEFNFDLWYVLGPILILMMWRAQVWETRAEEASREYRELVEDRKRRERNELHEYRPRCHP